MNVSRDVDELLFTQMNRNVSRRVTHHANAKRSAGKVRPMMYQLEVIQEISSEEHAHDRVDAVTLVVDVGRILGSWEVL